MKSKKKQITIVSCAAALAVIAIVAMILVIPRDARLAVKMWTPTVAYNPEESASIEIPADKEGFRILQLSDIQLWSNGKDNKEALEIAKKTAAETDPDLIILGGDNVSGLYTSTLFEQVLNCMEEIGKPWTTVFGNHDGEGHATLEWQAKKMTEAKHCIFDAGYTNLTGVGNHVINIKKEGKIVHSLILMDSGAKVKLADGTESYSYINYDQIAWYKWVVEGLAAHEGTTVASSAYFHIALPEFETAIKVNGLEKDADNEIKIPAELGFGAIREGIACPKYNSGLFDVMKSLGSTKHVFVAHDHSNDAVITYEGITMAYGLKTGPSPAPWNDAKKYGGTTIDVNSDGAITKIEHKVVKSLI